MKILLDKLILNYFKGCKKFVLEAKGRNCKVYGDNGTYKTTLADSWYYLLFGKDSRDQANFEIKTLDENNEPLHNLEHVVEGSIKVDGKPLGLKKVYYEVWTKKRGSATETFSGHTTDYYINDVPVKKRDYDDKIAEIIDEETFKMLTSPSYFNEVLHWEDRRRILLEVCGDVSDEDVITSDKKLVKLKDILAERSIDEHKKSVKAKQKKINEELKKIPVRIDEVTQGLPEIDGIDDDKIQAEIEVLKAEKKEKEAELSRLENGGEIAEKQKRLAEIETELEEIKRIHRSNYDESITERKAKLSTLNDKISQLQSDINSKQHSIKINAMTIERLEGKRQNLLTKWHAKNKEEFEYEQDTVCPTCGQKIPADKLQEAWEKAQSKFNLEKAKTLESITEEGKRVKARIDEYADNNAVLEKEVEELESKLPELESKASILKAEIKELQEEAEAYQDSFKYKKKFAEGEDIKKTIISLKESNKDSLLEIKQKIDGLDNNISDLQKELNKLDEYEKDQKRIQELSDQEKELAKQYEELEEELYLCEEFTRAKVNLLEEKINSKFQLVKFKLFEEQVNGGLKETCEALVNGVPYSTNLNTGARINAGVDIINTLADYYEFYAPIFVDGRESVTQLIPAESQAISLIVSEKDKKLRVKYEDKVIKEAS